MLTLNISPLFKARGITRPYTFLVKSGFTPHSAHNLISGAGRSIRLDHIEHLCRILLCEPNDLITYTPDKEHILPDNHPLNNLKQTDTLQEVTQALSKIPYKQLKEINKQITGTGKS